MNRLFGIILLSIPVAGFGQPAPSPTRGSFPGEEKRVIDDLNQADQLVFEKRWDEAIRRYLQILTDSGDLLTPVETHRALPARWVVHQKLAQLPANARKLFRDRTETAAAKWFEQGAAIRDIRVLKQVLAEAFITHSSEQAIHLLGDLAFERGEFESALSYWRMLARPASEMLSKNAAAGAFELIHPDPKIDSAFARAKQILALMFSGAAEPAETELAAFRKMHASSSGMLAGRNGNYADILQESLSARRSIAVNAAKDATAWSTFGGHESRSRSNIYSSSAYWPESIRWTVELPGDPSAKVNRDADPPLGTAAAARMLAFHPVVAAGHVLVADACRVFAYELTTGRLAANYDHRKTNAVPKSMDLRVPVRNDTQYTITIAGNCVYARFGSVTMQPSPEKDLGANDTWIVCLAMARDGDKLELRYRWQIRGRIVDSDPPALFEGAPLIHEDRLYVARTRFDGRQATTAIDCYDSGSADFANEPPLRKWTVDVWTTDAIDIDGPRTRHDLLTLAGPNIVLCTHSGAIVALDADTGKRAWATRYPTTSVAPIAGIRRRGLAPCVYDSGRLFVAPKDCNHLLCLDALTGAMLWQSAPTNVVDLLGVANNRVFVTLGGYPHGIRAYDSLRGTVQWTKPDEGDLTVFGRGVLTDRWIFWPTQHGLRILCQTSGEPRDDGSCSLPLGNLAFGEGCLVAASPTELRGFVPERYRLHELRRESSERTDDSAARLRLAHALFDAGNRHESLELAKRLEMETDAFLHGEPIAVRARRLRHALLIGDAALHWQEGRRDDARSLLEQATASEFGAPDRLRAAAHLVAAGGLPLSLLDDPEIAELSIIGTGDVPRSGSDELLRLLLDANKDRVSKHAMELSSQNADLAARRFSVIPQIRTRLLERAVTAERNGRREEALKLYRQWLSGANTGHTAEAHQALARIYRSLGHTRTAIAAQARFSKPSLEDWVLPPEAPLLDWPITMQRSWTVPLKRLAERPLAPMAGSEESLPITSFGRCFFALAKQVVCRDALSGKLLWISPLSFNPECIAVVADTILAAGPGGIARVTHSNGEKLWELRSPIPMSLRPQFSSPEPTTLFSSSTSETFRSFHLAGTLLVLLCESTMYVLDVEANRFLWRRSAPGAPLSEITYHSKLFANEDAIIAQTSDGRIIVIGTNNGAERFKLHNEGPLWTSAPVLVDTRRVVIPLDAEQLACVDTATGRIVWQRALSGWPSLSGSMPQLRRDGSSLTIVVERNYGFELERRDAGTGHLEVGPVFLGHDRVDLSAAGIAHDSYYLVLGQRLVAIGRDSGRMRWERRLPFAADWRLWTTQKGLIAAPESAIPVASWPHVQKDAVRQMSTLPSTARYHAALNLLYHGWVDRRWPLLQVAGDTGKIQKTLEFRSTGPDAVLLTGPKSAAVFVDGAFIGLATQ